MVEEEKLTSFEPETGGGFSWWMYLVGVIILVTVGFFIFGGKNPSILTGVKTSSTQPTPVINVTIEAIVEQIPSNQDTFFVGSAAGFTTLTYGQQTAFASENGDKLSASSVKPGTKVKAEGKPNGKIFEAKKVTVLDTVTNVTPAPAKLPGTGIVE